MSLDIAQVSAEVLVRKALSTPASMHVEVILRGRKVSFSSAMTSNERSQEQDDVVDELRGCTIEDYRFAQNERGEYYHLDDPDETFDFDELVSRIVQISDDNSDDIYQLASKLAEPCEWRIFVGAGVPCALADTSRKFVVLHVKGDTDADEHDYMFCATHAREALRETRAE